MSSTRQWLPCLSAFMQDSTKCVVERFWSCSSQTNFKPWSLATPTMTGRSWKRSYFKYGRRTGLFCDWLLRNSTNDFCLYLQSTEYKGEYWNDHPTIRLFWKVFHELPLEKKKQFLCKCCPLRDSILYMTCLWTERCLLSRQYSSQEVTAYPSWAWKAWNWWSSPPVEESITYLLPTPASTCWTCPSTQV